MLLTPKYALLLLVFIASAFRLLPMRFRYLLGYDPYFHLAYIRYALSHGWVNFFPYALGPWGILMKGIHPLGLWMTPAVVYKLLRPFGVSLFNAFRVTPVIFGVLTVIFVYFAVLKLYGKKEAFLSALLMAVAFGHIFRSMAGYYRGDNYMLFWYGAAFLSMAAGLKAFENASWKGRRAVLTATLLLLPGIFAGLSSAFWSAYYPIFVFIWANALTLSLGAFILGKKNVLISALLLTLSLVIGVFIANSIGAVLGYGMAGYNHGLARTLARELGLSLTFIRDAFLMGFLTYMVPVALGIIGVFWVSSRSGMRTKLMVLGAIALAVLVLALHYRDVIESILRMFSSFP
ncbi:STT3 domain-containing protein, partial [Thermococcus sp.]|uniref:STT3 domain-containing protein n=1 Tax=Thermococcus sp. TaxID=35749 RepID=UPI00345B6856